MNPILIPLLNSNEPEALLVSLAIYEQQAINIGDIVCTLETTKSTAEVLAEDTGFIIGLSFMEGQTVRAGDVLAYIAGSPDEIPPNVVVRAGSPANNPENQEIAPDSLPDGLRITTPALILARQHNLDLYRLPRDIFITENFVQSIIQASPNSSFDPTAIVVYGGGGHGKSVIELIQRLGAYRIVGVIDDGLPAGSHILGIPVLGGAAQLIELFAHGVRLSVNAVGGIGATAVRIQVFQRLAETGFVCPTIIHPTAFVEASAKLSAGVQVFPHAYIGSETKVGYGSIINTGAVVSHDCSLEDYVNISPNATLAGEVQVGAAALIGMGATINLRVQVGAGARIGNGATVKSDVPAQGIVRAGHIWPD